jgi:hypothetical protein
MSEPYDTVFALPSVDDDPDTELGVMLQGLGAERLLAGLGVAEDNDDPTTVTLIVDQLRHGARPGTTWADAVAAGLARWRVVEPSLAAAPGAVVRSAALRRVWASAAAVVATVPTVNAAERVYLTACWLRRTEIAEAEENHVLPDLTP